MKLKLSKALLVAALCISVVCTSCSKGVTSLTSSKEKGNRYMVTAYFKNVQGSIQMSLNGKKFKNVAPMNQINSAPSNYQIQLHYPRYGFGTTPEETAAVNRIFQENANNCKVYEVKINRRAPKVITVWCKMENYNYYMSKYELSANSKYWVLIGPVEVSMFGVAAPPSNALVQSVPKFKEYFFESSTREKVNRLNIFSQHKGSFNGGDGKVFSIHMFKE